MSRWLRLYADAMRNPKVIRLSDKDFRLWIRLLTVASENDGKIACLDDLKHMLSMRLDHLSSSVDRLISGGLIDALADGYEPHNWSKFQYKSDTSTERVTKHRAKRNVSVTPPDTETEQKLPLPNGNGAAPDSDQVFWEGAKDFLKPESKNPGAIVGKWVRDHGKAPTAEAITRAQLERPVQRIPFIEGCFRSHAREPVVPI